jgi:DNA primase small subunit
MASTEDEAVERTVAWLRDRFRRYYRKGDLLLPDRFTKREFGFMFFAGGMVQRHLAFASANEVRTFLVSRTPAHAYYSSAYYERPGAPTMDQKGWIGADLIFDLDADHIARVKDMAYGAMLEVVKDEIMKIVDQFLLGDFGFEERDLLITFSGGRGYHIHVRHPRVWELGSHERREIVDYITGKELDEDVFLRRVPFDVVRTAGGRVKTKYRVSMPSPREPGWRGRIGRGIVEAVERLEARGRRDGLRWLMSFDGVGKRTAEALWRILFDGSPGQRGVDKLRRGEVDIFPSDRFLTPFRRVFLPLAVDLGRRETDEPVTSDTKRLIRLPGSLHGKTGLRVVPVSRDALPDFRPLTDAVPDAWSSAATKVRLTRDIRIDLKGETFTLNQGVDTVPEYVAVFLACRGWATVA